MNGTTTKGEAEMIKKKEPEPLMDEARRMGTEAKHMGRQAWLATLGAVELAREEAEELFDRLVSKGEHVENDQDNALRKTYDQVRDKGTQMVEATTKRVQGAVSGVLHRAGVPDRDEIHTLIDRVEQLTQKVNAMGASR